MAKRRGRDGPQDQPTEDASAEAIERLTDELRVIRDILDEIREDLEHAIRNGKLGCRFLPPGFCLTSMSADPLAADFGERINELQPGDLPPEALPPGSCPQPSVPSEGPTVTVAEDDPVIETSPNPPPTLSVRQFHFDEERPAIPFCCVKPELEWVGDHDDPSIICAYCGETVAVLHDGAMTRPGANVVEEMGPPPSHAADAESPEESSEYCCPHPQLTWRGDPDVPGIVCASCGYVVAEYGKVIDDRDTRPDGFCEEKPTSQQGQLWVDDESA